MEKIHNNRCDIWHLQVMSTNFCKQVFALNFFWADFTRVWFSSRLHPCEDKNPHGYLRSIHDMAYASIFTLLHTWLISKKVDIWVGRWINLQISNQGDVSVRKTKGGGVARIVWTYVLRILVSNIEDVHLCHCKSARRAHVVPLRGPGCSAHARRL